MCKNSRKISTREKNIKTSKTLHQVELFLSKYVFYGMQIVHKTL